ncbi:MAG: YfhO family protein [Verrucomicrobiae bacterium]
MLSPTVSSAKAPAASDEDWLNPRRFAGLLALLVLASWPQIWLGLQTFEYRDFGIFSYPIAHYFRESFWRGEIPLWNPLSACGTPFLAQWNTQVLYPPALFYLLLPLSWSLGVFCLLHLFWGGLGMYLLAQAWVQNRRAAAFAGIAFAFNGLMLSSLIWPATIAGLGWMPWVVWLVQRAGREGGRTLIWAALAGTMQMLSGAAEPVLLTWALVAGLTLVELGRNAVARGRIIFRFGALVALISALSAAQLLPFLDLLDYSRRQQEISAAVWPMPPTGWTNYFVPLFHCHAFQGVFMQAGQSWINSYYIGLITLVLAVLALRQIRRPQVWLLAALLLACGVLALGEATPVYGWLARHVSVIGLVRFPVKFLILPALLLPLMAALALAKNTFAAGQKNQPWLLLIGGSVFVITLGIAGWIWRFEPPGAGRTTLIMNGVTRAVFLVAILMAWLWSKKISGVGPRRLGQLLPLLLLWLDLNWQMPPPATVHRAIYEPNLPRSQPLPSAETARVLIPSTVHNAFDHTALPDAATDYLVRRFGLAGNCNLLDHVAKCDGFFPLYLSVHAAWYYNYFDDRQPAMPLLDFLGVANVLENTGNRFVWRERNTFLPRLTVGQKPIFADDLTTLVALTNVNFAPQREVYLPAEAHPFVTVSHASAAQILSFKSAAQHLEATVVATEPTMLVAAQTYYHPWQAYVDGQPVRLWRANYAFQALVVPAGTHQVKLVYEDQRFYFGSVVSLVTLGGCICFFFRRQKTAGGK